MMRSESAVRVAASTARLDDVADSSPLVTFNTFSVTIDDCSENGNVDGDDSTDKNKTCPALVTNAHPAEAMMYLPCNAKCKICCALPFRRSAKDDESEGILWDDASPWDWDGGLYDLVCQLNGRDQYPKLQSEIAKITVEATTKHLALMKDELIKAGLQKHYNQNYCGESLSSSRVIAPFDFAELEMGQLDVAESYFKQVLSAIAKDEDNSSAYISLAQIALQRKDKQTADSWLSKIESKDGKNPAWFTIQMRRALLLASDRKFLEARQFLQTITTNTDSEQVLLLQTEAQIMRDAGQSTEAFVLLQMALSEFPRSPELLYDFAMLAESLKQYPDMEMALKQLIQIAPNNALAYNALGYSYADRNMQLDEALALIEAANQLNPNDPYILDSLGWVKYRLKQYADAERYLRLSLGMRQDADVSVHLAEILWVQNKKDEALQLFSEARKRDPDNTLLKSTLQRLELNLP